MAARVADFKLVIHEHDDATKWRYHGHYPPSPWWPAPAKKNLLKRQMGKSLTDMEILWDVDWTLSQASRQSRNTLSIHPDLTM